MANLTSGDRSKALARLGSSTLYGIMQAYTFQIFRVLRVLAHEKLFEDHFWNRRRSQAACGRSGKGNSEGDGAQVRKAGGRGF